MFQIINDIKAKCRLVGRARDIYYEAASYNIPILILYAMSLTRDNLAFVHRDCCFLQPIHEVLTGCKNIRFDCSRAALKAGGDEYLEYIKKTILGKTVIELQCTGKGLSEYCSINHLPEPRITTLCKIGNRENVNGICKNPTLGVIEHFNCSEDGSLLKWPDKREEQDVLMEPRHAQRDAVRAVLELLPGRVLDCESWDMGQIMSRMKDSITRRTIPHKERHV